MTEPPSTDIKDGTTRPSLARNLLRLARPHQWSKSVFVLVGPFYGATAVGGGLGAVAAPAIIASVAFALASSGCYVINDLIDAPQDRMHPRKKNRPLAAGLVTPKQAIVFAAALLFASALATLALPAGEPRMLLGVTLGLYVANVLSYSALWKRRVIADVMSLSIGFVLRVLGGCAAAAIVPSGWLLNCTFFLSMFLAFGKRLGERRTLGDLADAARSVQTLYTDTLLQMAVVVTGVSTLLGYTVYVETQSMIYEHGFNLLWLTVLPATYVLFRCIVLMEGGLFDDPTEMAASDRPFQLGSLLFVLLTALLMWKFGAHAAAATGAL